MLSEDHHFLSRPAVGERLQSIWTTSPKNSVNSQKALGYKKTKGGIIGQSMSKITFALLLPIAFSLPSSPPL
jgi:hypothetical protein